MADLIKDVSLCNSEVKESIRKMTYEIYLCEFYKTNGDNLIYNIRNAIAKSVSENSVEKMECNIKPLSYEEFVSCKLYLTYFKTYSENEKNWSKIFSEYKVAEIGDMINYTLDNNDIVELAALFQKSGKRLRDKICDLLEDCGKKEVAVDFFSNNYSKYLKGGIQYER